MQNNELNRRTWLGAVSSAIPAFAITAPPKESHLNILRPPDFVTAFAESGPLKLTRNGDEWQSSGVSVDIGVKGPKLPIRVRSETVPLLRVLIRWTETIPEHWRILNDQWERSYGDLEWRGMSGDRVLPWYFMSFDGQRTHGYGVQTGAHCFAFWQVDPAGISLWLDVRNGGSGVRLGQRTLDAVTVCMRPGLAGESSFAATRQFCRMLCETPRLPPAPVYGGNNWYYAYGENCSAKDIERDSDLIAELAPSAGNRPFMVIDDGWSVASTAGPWKHGNSRFPDMPGLTASMKRKGVRPGVWLRPLCTTASTPESAVLRKLDSEGRVALDPTVPETISLVRSDIARLVSWGFELIKHDFSSFDLLGRWGFAMGPSITNGGWHFADRSKTSAEIALELYRTIREAAGQTLLIGCNTFGHLAAGLFEIQRTGDDTSGRDFDRTRRMGVNTLAFRAGQHGNFFDLDADCVPITPEVPWSMTSQWLDLAARSGTALFVSADPRAITGEVRTALRQAFKTARTARPVGEPLDWMEITTPYRWKLEGETATYQWFEAEGGNPFGG